MKKQCPYCQTVGESDSVSAALVICSACGRSYIIGQTPDFNKDGGGRSAQKSPENTGEFREGTTSGNLCENKSSSTFHSHQNFFSEVEMNASHPPAFVESSQAEVIDHSQDQLPSDPKDSTMQEETAQEEPAAEETVDVKCPHCGVICEAPAHALNREGTCPSCENQFKLVKLEKLREQNDQRAQQPFFTRLMDEITKGRYSRYKKLEYRKPLADLRQTVFEMNRLNKYLREELQSCRDERKKIIEDYQRQSRERELRGHGVKELLNLTGVGEASVEKLLNRGVSNFYELNKSLETVLDSCPRIPIAVREKIKYHVRNVAANLKFYNPPLNPSIPEVRRLLEIELLEEWLTARIPAFEQKEKEVSKMPQSYSPLTFLRFVLFSGYYEKSAVDLKKDLARAGELWHEYERQTEGGVFKFDELTQDEYLRAIGLLQKRFKSGSAAPVTGEETKRVGLPFDSDLVAKIENFELDTSSIRNCILRRYQEFAASFAMVQRHVLLGDEMGLGKTVEAMAVISHLAALKDRIFVLVVVPASLRENWRREILSKTTIQPHLLYPTNCTYFIKRWAESGGIGIVSYDTLRSRVQEMLASVSCFDLVVSDEVQYIKNNFAGRTVATRKVIARGRRCMLMTGTPIENHPKEFATIINAMFHGVPMMEKLEQNKQLPSSKEFKEKVQYVYLRRNKEDVLDELPELIEITDWVELPHRELKLHLDMIERKEHIMTLRQHAILGNGESPVKITRIRELADEYREEGRNVVIFTFFRKVIAKLNSIWPEAGVITGDVATSVRMSLIDSFSKHSSGKGNLLISQVVAGGLGVNLQAASAVIIVEPQLNPAVEYQAICRAHRMGQRNDVNVHRLVAKSTIEEGLTAMLAQKRKYLDDYARDSLLKEKSPSALSKEEIEQAMIIQGQELRKELELAG